MDKITQSTHAERFRDYLLAFGSLAHYPKFSEFTATPASGEAALARLDDLAAQDAHTGT